MSSILSDFSEYFRTVEVLRKKTSMEPGVGYVDEDLPPETATMAPLPARPSDLKQYLDGTNIANAKTFYQEGIPAANIGDVVRIAEGSFKILNLLDYSETENIVIYYGMKTKRE